MPGPLGEIAFGVGLDPPGNLPNEVGAVPGADGLAVQLLVPLGQLAGGQLLQGVDLFRDVGGHVWLLS